MDLIRVEDRLPENNEYVLIHLTITNWKDKDDTGGKRFWRVAKFIRGISKEEREAMKQGRVYDPIEIGRTCPTPPGEWVSHETRRSNVHKSEDESGNNLVPYCWDEFGPGNRFGQDVDLWAELPSKQG